MPAGLSGPHAAQEGGCERSLRGILGDCRPHACREPFSAQGRGSQPVVNQIPQAALQMQNICNCHIVPMAARRASVGWTRAGSSVFGRVASHGRLLFV